ncbi:MAG: site-2 protease family protein [Fluviicola sp.]
MEHKPRSSAGLTVLSLVLFAMVFFWIFGVEEFNFLLMLIAVLVIHEMGHFTMMKVFKYENVRMLFIPLMGAFVQGKKRRYSQRESFMVVFAGPLPGMIIGSALLWYSNEYHIDWMLQLSALFLLLNIINLLPLDPLDGGQLFKLFGLRNHEFLLMAFAFVSSIIIIALGFFIGEFGYLLIIFGFLMGFRVRAMQKQYHMHQELSKEDVNYKKSYKSLSNREFARIKQVVLEHTPQLKKYIDQISEDQSDPLIASQVNNVLVTPLKNDASPLFRTIVLMLWLLAFALPFLMYFTLDLVWIRSAFFLA